MEKNVKEQNKKNKKVLSPSQRNDKPSAILWLIKNCPEIADSQIRKLVGTTNPTIDSIRNGTHKDMASLWAKNPVTVGLCSDKDLEKAINTAKGKVERAAIKAEKEAKKAAKKKAAAKKKTACAKKKTTETKKKAAKKTTKKTTAKKSK